ncbi:GPW/gp25 family protein [Ruegeria sp. 2205SS24-7]|uniref:GPW/gp25 family protein n=1 Tax=Ruegeria discodermiae TaxID=3064389 RepID=UPI0027418729|nr:GPW/gp25 family protein [Ruegeria sp. 2205SS24-7]MDP5220845.1 GPW/gp25 family protein [Ruegeria sp. 2205SS24-7]
MTARATIPYRFDGSGRTRDVDEDTWVRGLVEQVLFTAPGERVMRPTLGSGLAELVFAPNSPELAGTVQFLVQGALQQWLSDIVTTNNVEVTAVEATLTVRVTYTILRTGLVETETFERGLNA